MRSRWNESMSMYSVCLLACCLLGLEKGGLRLDKALAIRTRSTGIHQRPKCRAKGQCPALDSVQWHMAWVFRLRATKEGEVSRATGHRDGGETRFVGYERCCAPS